MNLFVVVIPLNEFERKTIWITEVAPTPTSERTFINDVDVGIELNSFGFKFCLGCANIIDMEADVGCTEVIIWYWLSVGIGTICIFNEFKGSLIIDPERDLTELGVGTVNALL